MSLHDLKVLIIDNDDEIITLLRDTLLDFGFGDITMSSDAANAIRLMEEKKFDLILSDWEMHPMSGVEFIKFIRNNPKSPDFFIPIIMISGRSEKHNIEFARDIGITEFLAKPFTIEALRSRIVSIVENPRQFIFSKEYNGPCRRRKDREAMDDHPDRRSEE